MELSQQSVSNELGGLGESGMQVGEHNRVQHTDEIMPVRSFPCGQDGRQSSFICLSKHGAPAQRSPSPIEK